MLEEQDNISAEPSDEPEDTQTELSEKQPELLEKQPERRPEVFKVKVNGEEKEVDIDELIRGYMRQSDYTRKRQEEAELRKLGEQFKQLLSDPSIASKFQKLFETQEEEEAGTEEEELDYETKLKKDIVDEIANKFGLKELQQKQMQQELENIFAGLQENYGDGVINYKDQVMNIFYQRPDLNPQDIFKVIAFDDYLRGAIELGRQLEREEQEKRSKGRVSSGLSGSGTEDVKKLTAVSLDEALAKAQAEINH